MSHCLCLIEIKHKWATRELATARHGKQIAWVHASAALFLHLAVFWFLIEGRLSSLNSKCETLALFDESTYKHSKTATQLRELLLRRCSSLAEFVFAVFS